MTSDHHWLFGTFLHTPELGRLEVIEHTLIEIDGDGTITSLTPQHSELFARKMAQAEASGALERLGDQRLAIPGLIDLHVHAPQWPQLGKALHLPLQDWLQEHTFPLEARYADIAYAQQVYPSLVRSLLANGTTTAMYFATVHEQATELLASTCLELGQRAYVGRVAMDDPSQCPDYYRDAGAAESLAASERSIRAIRALGAQRSGLSDGAANSRANSRANSQVQPRVQPVITPRFIPSCTTELLEALGELAAQEQCHVQTHCSESDWEHQYVLDRLARTDTQALFDFGLLNRHTVLAHSNFITAADTELIKHAGAGIAHCPLSNAYFADSVFPLRRMLNKSLRVGLGTDIAGGHSASMFNACQHAISASRLLESGTDANLPAAQRSQQTDTRINFMEAFYLATAGAADVLDCPVGTFAVGQQFDALILQLDHPDNQLNQFTEAGNWQDLFSCIVYNTQQTNIEQVWVDGARLTLD